MPNPWTGKGNPYTRKEVRERLMDTIKKGDAVIAAGAGAGISAKFIEKGGADLIIIYNSGRFRMMGHGSTCGMMAYGDANAIAMEIGEYEVLPVVEECPVICGVHATDPRRRAAAGISLRGRPGGDGHRGCLGTEFKVAHCEILESLFMLEEDNLAEGLPTKLRTQRQLGHRGVSHVFGANEHLAIAIGAANDETPFPDSGKQRITISCLEVPATFSSIAKNLYGVAVAVRPRCRASNTQEGKQEYDFDNSVHNSRP